MLRQSVLQVSLACIYPLKDALLWFLKKFFSKIQISCYYVQKEIKNSTTPPHPKWRGEREQGRINTMADINNDSNSSYSFTVEIFFPFGHSRSYSNVQVILFCKIELVSFRFFSWPSCTQIACPLRLFHLVLIYSEQGAWLPICRWGLVLTFELSLPSYEPS